MNAAPGVETLKSPIEHSCDNCGRAVTQDGRAVVTDAGKVFCEMNCYWVRFQSLSVEFRNADLDVE